MAAVETQETFNCTVEQFYNLLLDYESYGDFLDDVDSCEIVEEDDDYKIVEYRVTVVKSFSYRLRMEENGEDMISWTLESGDLFKVSNGSWELEEKDGKTLATYTIDAKFKVFVPGPIAKMAVNINLPNMMKSYHKRVDELYNT